MFRDQGKFVVVNCSTCGTQFKDYVSNQRKYCERRCYEIAKKGTRHRVETIQKMLGRPAWNKGKPNPMTEATRLKMVGRVPYNKGIPATLEQRQKISAACNRGKTTEARKVRASTEYATWRDRVFKRDQYRCQICSCGGKLNAHHIFAFSQYPDWRFHLSNGITLCRYCHDQEHRGWPDYLEFKIGAFAPPDCCPAL